MKSPRSTILLLFVSGFLLGGCFNRPPKGTEAFYNRSYGTNQRNKLDIYLPETRDTNTTTVLLVHGGAWVAGDKGGGELRDVRNVLLEAGYAVASMNYRYANEDYRNQMEDMDLAISYLRSNASDWIINGSKFALMGFSAGGHLSLLYAHAFDEENVVKTVISNVGPTDFTDTLFQQYASNYNLWWTVEKLLGATLNEDPALYQEASPLYNWSDKPTLLIYGAMDDLVPAEQGIAMFDTLTANGVIADTIIPAQGTHNVNGPNNIYKGQIESEVILWLGTHLN